MGQSSPSEISDKPKEKPAPPVIPSINPADYQRGNQNKAGTDQPGLVAPDGTLNIPPLFDWNGKSVLSAGEQSGGNVTPKTSDKGLVIPSERKANSVTAAAGANGQVPPDNKETPRSTDADGNVFIFNASGKAQSADLKDGRHVEYFYRKSGELDHTTEALNGDVSTFDAGHTLLSAQLANGFHIKYAYLNGKVDHLSIERPDKTIITTDSHNVTQQVDSPNGEHIAYIYGSDNRLAKITVSGVNEAATYQFIPAGNDKAGAGHWEQYAKDGTDQGQVDPLLSYMSTDGSPDRTITLHDKTLNAWQISQFGVQDNAWLNTAFTELNKALHDGEPVGSTARETVTNICKQVSQMPVAEKEKLLFKYAQETGRDLLQQLKEQKYYLAAGYLNRGSAEAGVEEARVLDAIQQMGGPQHKEEAAKILRESLSRLTEKQIKELESGEPPLSKQLADLYNHLRISKESYQTAGLYLQHPADCPQRNSAEFYRQLADIAINGDVKAIVNTPEGPGSQHNLRSCGDAERLELLREAFGQQETTARNNVAQIARDRLIGNKEFMARFENDFETNNAHMEAGDLLHYGQCTLATRIRQNSGAYDNQNTVTHAVEQEMSEQERRMFGAGRRAAALLTQADRESFLSASDMPSVPIEAFEKYNNGIAETFALAQSMKYYRDLHNAFESAGGQMTLLFRGTKTAAVHTWEDIAEHGHKTLEGQLAEKYGMFQNGSAREVEQVLNNMSREDYKRLKEDPVYRERINKSLDDLADHFSFNPENMKQKIATVIVAESYESFTGKELCALAAKPTADQIAQALTNLNVKEHQELIASPSIQARLSKQIDTLPQEAQRLALHRMMARALSMDPAQAPQWTAVDKLLLGAADYKEGKINIKELRHSFIAAAGDPGEAELFKQISSGNMHTQEAQAVSNALFESLGDVYGKDMLPSIRGTVTIENLVAQNTVDHMKVSGKADAATIVHETDFQNLISELPTLSAQDRQRLLKIKAEDEIHRHEESAKLMPNLTVQQRELVLAVAANPSSTAGEVSAPRPEDQVRMYIVDRKADARDVIKLFDSLTFGQRQEAAQEYARKYGANMLKDMSDRAPNGIRPELLHVANPDRNQFEQAMQQLDVINHALRTGLLRDTVREWDGSGGRVDELFGKLARTNDPTKIHEIEEELATAVIDEKGTSKQVANTIVDTMYLAAAVAAVPAEAALGPILLPTVLAVSGGAVRVGAHRAVEGEAYGNDGQALDSQVARDALAGAVSFGGTRAGIEVARLSLGNPAVQSAVGRMIADCGRDKTIAVLNALLEEIIANRGNYGRDSHTVRVTKGEMRAALRQTVEALVP